MHTVTFSHRFLLFGSTREFPWDCGTIQSHAKTLPCARSIRSPSRRRIVGKRWKKIENSYGINVTFRDVKTTLILQVKRCVDFWVHTERWHSSSTWPATSNLQQACWHILQQLVTSRYQDTFAWLATACWRQVYCKLPADLLQVVSPSLLSTSLLKLFKQVVTSLQMISWNKSVPFLAV